MLLYFKFKRGKIIYYFGGNIETEERRAEGTFEGLVSDILYLSADWLSVSNVVQLPSYTLGFVCVTVCTYYFIQDCICKNGMERAWSILGNWFPSLGLGFNICRIKRHTHAISMFLFICDILWLLCFVLILNLRFSFHKGSRCTGASESIEGAQSSLLSAQSTHLCFLQLHIQCISYPVDSVFKIYPDASRMGARGAVYTSCSEPQLAGSRKHLGWNQLPFNIAVRTFHSGS